MRVLSFDPGAKRCGWAVLEDGPFYVKSDWEENDRYRNEKFQDYRMRLVEHWVGKSYQLISLYQPEVVVTEVVPSRGYKIPEQLYLTNVVASTIQTMTLALASPLVDQVSARTVQSNIALRGRSKKITKPQVRNGVVSLIPELQEHLSGIKVWEESDALAIGLYYLGYSNK